MHGKPHKWMKYIERPTHAPYVKSKRCGYWSRVSFPFWVRRIMESLRPRPHVSGYFWIRNFSFRIKKYFHSHVAYSNRICLTTRIRNVFGFTLRTPKGNRDNKACATKENWKFHGKELGSILLRHPDKKKIRGFSGSIAGSKVSALEGVFKKFRIRQWIRRVRVERRRIPKDKVADSKISGYVLTGPKKANETKQ